MILIKMGPPNLQKSSCGASWGVLGGSWGLLRQIGGSEAVYPKRRTFGRKRVSKMSPRRFSSGTCMESVEILENVGLVNENA